jgi:hypothetical protein
MRAFTFGIALSILGIIIIAHAESNLFSSKKVIKTQTVPMTMLRPETIQWGPIIGLLFFVGGIGFAVYAKRSTIKIDFNKYKEL